MSLRRPIRLPDRDLRGNPAVLTVRYDDLSVIAWNDRISCFHGLASNGGTFFEHIYGSATRSAWWRWGNCPFEGGGASAMADGSEVSHQRRENR